MPWSEKYIDTRLAAYQKLEDEVETCFNKVIPERQDAYFQLVKYPLQASAEMNKKYFMLKSSPRAGIMVKK